jgi:hypothetical protein
MLDPRLLEFFEELLTASELSGRGLQEVSGSDEDAGGYKRKD